MIHHDEFLVQQLLELVPLQNLLLLTFHKDSLVGRIVSSVTIQNKESVYSQAN